VIRRNNETIGIECGDQFNEEEWKREKEGRGVYRDRDKKLRSNDFVFYFLPNASFNCAKLHYWDIINHTCEKWKNDSVILNGFYCIKLPQNMRLKYSNKSISPTADLDPWHPKIPAGKQSRCTYLHMKINLTM